MKIDEIESNFGTTMAAISEKFETVQSLPPLSKFRPVGHMSDVSHDNEVQKGGTVLKV